MDDGTSVKPGIHSQSHTPTVFKDSVLDTSTEKRAPYKFRMEYLINKNGEGAGNNGFLPKAKAAPASTAKRIAANLGQGMAQVLYSQKSPMYQYNRHSKYPSIVAQITCDKK